jgi:hypothetical protein
VPETSSKLSDSLFIALNDAYLGIDRDTELETGMVEATVSCRG